MIHLQSKRNFRGRARMMATSAITLGLLAASSFAPVMAAAQGTGPAERLLGAPMERQLVQYPGGIQISANEISYAGGAVIISTPMEDSEAGSIHKDARALAAAPNVHGCPAGD